MVRVAVPGQNARGACQPTRNGIYYQNGARYRSPSGHHQTSSGTWPRLAQATTCPQMTAPPCHLAKPWPARTFAAPKGARFRASCVKLGHPCPMGPNHRDRWTISRAWQPTALRPNDEMHVGTHDPAGHASRSTLAHHRGTLAANFCHARTTCACAHAG
jgi:hypothetical protein